jgi:5-methylcytosine-specific restriction endonuclease McrA
MDELRLPLGKYCTKCDEWKLLEDYHRHPHTKDRRQVRCKVCACQARKDWAANNPKAVAEHTHKFIARYREDAEFKAKIQAYNLTQYYRHKDRHNEVQKRWYESNRERRSETRRKWRQAHPELNKVYHYRWIARRRSNGGAFTLDEWQSLCTHCDWRCLCCGGDKPLTVDHVVPVSKGGSDDISNIQPLCQSCNSSKGAKTIDYRFRP